MAARSFLRELLATHLPFKRRHLTGGGPRGRVGLGVSLSDGGDGDGVGLARSCLALLACARGLAWSARKRLARAKSGPSGTLPS